MKRKLYYTVLIASAMLLPACTDFLEPLPNGTVPEDEIWNRPAHIEGFVGHAYSYFPKNYANNRGFYLDGATDDAVITNRSHNMNRFGIGTMGTDNDPFKDDIYIDSYRAIISVNRFLEDNKGLNTRYSINERENELKRKRLHGEAFALRAWYEWELLKYYGGVGAKSGKLLGISIIKDAFHDVNEDVLWTPRSTYEESVKQIQEDCDSAFLYIADAHRDWLKEDPKDVETGAILWGAMDKLGLKAMLSRMYLTYASPLYNPTDDPARWEKAAEAALDAIELKLDVDGEHGFDPNAGVDWNNPNFPGIISPSPFDAANLSAEQAFYPASLKGTHNGAIGATQELVDAFPMSNGYPIDHPLSDYNPQRPYEGRDARFYSTIFYNQAEARDNSNALIHKFESWTSDGNTGVDYAGNPKTSLTNYHIKKFIYKGYNPNDNSKTKGGPRSKYIYRWAHVLLDFAEAANEVGGPNKEFDYKYGKLSAKKAISMLRSRKTYDGTETGYATSDPYLEELAQNNDKIAFREFIRNERRIETCFEGMRYFDLRRWSKEDDLSLLNAVVHRPEITRNAAGQFVYSEGTEAKPHVVVATRKFTSPYIPLPYDEILTVDGIEQNKGWKAWE